MEVRENEIKGSEPLGLGLGQFSMGCEGEGPVGIVEWTIVIGQAGCGGEGGIEGVGEQFDARGGKATAQSG